MKGARKDDITMYARLKARMLLIHYLNRYSGL